MQNTEAEESEKKNYLDFPMSYISHLGVAYLDQTSWKKIVDTSGA